MQAGGRAAKWKPTGLSPLWTGQDVCSGGKGAARASHHLTALQRQARYCHTCARALQSLEEQDNRSVEGL
eukprot:scaffold395_cov383-Prasinococcus_capsulatus_cf.AAC.11